MKVFFCLLLLAIHAQSQLPVNRSRVVLAEFSNAANLTIWMNNSGYLDWSFFNQKFAVLGSTNCPAGLRIVRRGSNVLNWECDKFNTTGNGDAVNAALPGCTSELSIPVLGSTGWSCGPDRDRIGALNCIAGQIPKWNGTVFYCAPELDLVRDAATACWASGGGVPYIQSDGTLACKPTVNDTDFARDLANTTGACKTGQVIKYIDGAWRCATDKSLLSEFNNCTAGQTLIFNVTGNSAWSCYTPSDILGSLMARCLAVGGTTPIKNATGWECYPPQNQLAESTGITSQMVFSAVALVGAGSVYPSSGFTGQAGFPFRLPFNSTIIAWGIRALQGTFSVSLGSTAGTIDTYTRNTTGSFYINRVFGSGAPLLANTDFGIRVNNSYSLAVTVTADIYVNFTLSQ